MKWVLLLCLLCPLGATARADWEVKRDPFDPVVIAQYRTILTRDPHDADALRRLVQLHERFRSLAKLEAEWRTKLDAQPGDWATLVVLARLPRSEKAATLALWKRALEANPNDGRGWFAYGKLAPDPATARDAFRRAADLATTPRDKRPALVELVGVARRANDPRSVDRAYVELIDMAPKDANLWLDRGNAQLAVSWFEAALESFQKAEALFTTDPERRLTAMIQQGIVLEKLGRVDQAIARWQLALDKTPRDSYLRREIVPRIVDAERKRGQLAIAIALLEKRWPEPQRGYYEWDLLGDLFREILEHDRALAAYKKAVARAPTEITTQRKLIALLDQQGSPDALKQLELAARLAPGDGNLQIDLAKRYFPHDRGRAFAVIDKVAKRLAKDPGMHQALAELYMSWDERSRAIVHYEALADLEPKEQEHAVVLGEAYWRAGQRLKAILAWERLAKLGTAKAFLRQAEILSLHSAWNEAVVAYTETIARDATQVEAWRGRARAHDELRQYAAAVSDARRAVALIGNAPDDAGHRVRFQLVRALDRWKSTGQITMLQTLLAQWRFAFDKGDIAAGYLLLAHHDRIQSHQQHDILVALYRRVPNDEAIGMALARSFAKRKEYARAKTELEVLAKRVPKRAEEIGHMIVQLEADRVRAEREAFWDEEGLSERERRLRRNGGVPDLIGKKLRLGTRLMIGTDVQGTSSALYGFGLYQARRWSDGTSIEKRLDWQQRNDEAEQMNAVAFGLAAVKRVKSTKRFEVALSAGPRFELRYSREAEQSAWARAGLGLDLGALLVPRALPATIGARFHQSLTDNTRGSTLVVELGFEVRP